MIYTRGEYGLRYIEKKDLQMLFKWRNLEQIHKQMLTDHVITWEEHIAWYQCIRNNQIQLNYVFCLENKPIGYIGYTEYDEKKRSCSPSVYLGNIEDIPLDAAFSLFYISIEYAFSEMHMDVLNTVVFKKNKKARKLDYLLGYQLVREEEFIKNGKIEVSERIVLTKEEWIVKREIIQYKFRNYRVFDKVEVDLI